MITEQSLGPTWVLEEKLGLSPVSEPIEGHCRHKSAHMVEHEIVDLLPKETVPASLEVGFVEGASPQGVQLPKRAGFRRCAAAVDPRSRMPARLSELVGNRDAF